MRKWWLGSVLKESWIFPEKKKEGRSIGGGRTTGFSFVIGMMMVGCFSPWEWSLFG